MILPNDIVNIINQFVEPFDEDKILKERSLIELKMLGYLTKMRMLGDFNLKGEWDDSEDDENIDSYTETLLWQIEDDYDGYSHDDIPSSYLGYTNNTTADEMYEDHENYCPLDCYWIPSQRRDGGERINASIHTWDDSCFTLKTN